MMLCTYIDSQLTFYTHKDNLKHSSRLILLVIHGFNITVLLIILPLPLPVFCKPQHKMFSIWV